MPYIASRLNDIIYIMRTLEKAKHDLAMATLGIWTLLAVFVDIRLKTPQQVYISIQLEVCLNTVVFIAGNPAQLCLTVTV